MSVVTKAIGCAKKIKHHFQDQIREHTPVYLSPVRRIEKVALKERICAMTFDDGPCRLPANPAAEQEPLTLRLAKTLEQFGARGTFDIVGDTSANYPDRAGKEGTAAWGGTRFDHYPDFKKDSQGGAVHCPELVKRLLDGGHEITNHTYSHVLFGPKSLVYRSRQTLHSLSECVEDLKRLDEYMKQSFGYEMRLSRPPHYVDRIKDGFSSYDAYALMGYQYMAASFDGAGWLPGKSYEAEVEAMVSPIAKALAENPDSLCGQIIFQKDGFNMARRSPVADGLARQLKLLTEQGYKIVTVSEMLAKAPFLDIGADHVLFDAARGLLHKGWCICYRDNTVRPEAPMTRGELAMFAYGCHTAEQRVEMVCNRTSVCNDISAGHPYAAAVSEALKAGVMSASKGNFRPDEPLSGQDFNAFCRAYFGQNPQITKQALTHGDVIKIVSKMAL